MLDNNAQAIFLLTYPITKINTPLSAKEYSALAQRVNQAELHGPAALLNMTEIDLNSTLGLNTRDAKRVRNLLNQAGSATLYLDQVFNQGFNIITRTDSDYPDMIKSALLNSSPPFLTYIGNKQVLNDICNPLIISVSDGDFASIVSKLTGKQDLILTIHTVRDIKLLQCFSNYRGNLLILTDIGLLCFVRSPILRKLLSSDQIQVVSSSHLEAKEMKKPQKHLHSLAIALSKTNDNNSEKEQKPTAQHMIYFQDEKTFKEEEGVVHEKHSRFQKEVTEYPDILHKPINVISQQNETIEDDEPPKDKVIYTVGHSNLDVRKFLELLKNHNIDMLVDVRSSPISKYVPHFSQINLKASLKQAGIEYLFLGQKLGGRPKDMTVFNSQGKIVRECIEEREWYNHGIKEIESLTATGKTIAIMCSEEDPKRCHRGYIVSNTLVERNFIIKHIRQDGVTQTLKNIPSPSDQLELFF